MRWINLHEVGISNKEIRYLMNNYKNVKDIYSDNTFKTYNDELKKKLEIAYYFDDDSLVDKYRQKNVKIVDANNEGYPRQLKEIDNYPLFLYIKGNKNLSELLQNSSFNQQNRRNVAVVGTRRYTKYGLISCKNILLELFDYNITLISGLARGIDSIALETSISNKNRTIAVVGSGVDIVYPYENKFLWQQICENGCIISEYPLGTKPLKWNFPQRNRIIAGLSDAVLVGESYAKGGSLITVEYALQYNKEIFAIPGCINLLSFEGCNNLIKHHKARLITCAEDIAKELMWERKVFNSLKNKDFTEDELIIVSNLNEELSLEELRDKIKLNNGIILEIPKILFNIMNLKLNDIVLETNNSKYIINKFKINR